MVPIPRAESMAFVGREAVSSHVHSSLKTPVFQSLVLFAFPTSIVSFTFLLYLTLPNFFLRDSSRENTLNNLKQLSGSQRKQN